MLQEEWEDIDFKERGTMGVIQVCGAILLSCLLAGQ